MSLLGTFNAVIHGVAHQMYKRLEQPIDHCLVGLGHIAARDESDVLAELAGQISRKVDAALQTLPAKQKTAFILKNQQGLSIKEIAELMQTAEGTVKVHLHRAVTALRTSLAEFA